MNTKTNTLLIAAVAALLGLVIGLVVSGGFGYTGKNGWYDRHPTGYGHMSMYGPGFDAGYMPMHGTGYGGGLSAPYEAGYPGMGMGYGMMGQMHANMMARSEQEFLEHMIPHHEEAVATAREVLERGGTTATMRTLLSDIIEAQTAEINDMKAWYEAWYGEAYEPTGEYVPMMRDLAGYSGETLDAVFLADMIRHHMGAIMMAQSVQPYIEHEEVADLTESIVRTQSQEIDQMQQMLWTARE